MGIIPPYYTMCLSSHIADQKIQISTTMVYEYTLKKKTLGPVWIEEKEGRVKRNRVELAENRLILGQFYFSLLFSPNRLRESFVEDRLKRSMQLVSGALHRKDNIESIPFAYDKLVS